MIQSQAAENSWLRARIVRSPVIATAVGPSAAMHCAAQAIARRSSSPKWMSLRWNRRSGAGETASLAIDGRQQIDFAASEREGLLARRLVGLHRLAVDQQSHFFPFRTGQAHAVVQAQLIMRALAEIAPQQR